MTTEHDKACWRVWALDRACERNKYARIEVVLAEAEKFSQFIERRTDAEIVAFKKEGKK